MMVSLKLDEAFLAEAEVSEKRMTLAEKEEMIKAKQQELRQYFDNKVWEFAELGEEQNDFRKMGVGVEASER